ncbi:MAG: 3-isopropylmalate dehydrogenase, partial [Erysipelotrichales bacterium]
SAKTLIEYINNNTNIKIECIDAPFGGSAIEKYDTPFPNVTKELLNKVDAVLLSAVGDERYNNRSYTPENALLDLRKELDVYINLRPFKTIEKLSYLTSFKKEVLSNVNFLFFRELSSGAYFGKPRVLKETEAIDTIYYNCDEIERIVRAAFEYCNKNNKLLTSVDKANVLATSKLWRATVDRISNEFPSVEYEHRLVDSCAMDLVMIPSHFDVIVTDNLFGDILSDQSAALLGSLGMMCSASLGSSISLYEPGHGSAPDIAGQGIANPIAMLKSVAMMYEHSFNNKKISEAIDDAIMQTINDDIFTYDLNKNNYFSTKDFITKVIERMNL